MSHSIEYVTRRNKTNENKVQRLIRSFSRTEQHQISTHII